MNPSVDALLDIARHVTELGSVLAAFWVYFDGLDLIPALEANLWAVAMFLSGPVLAVGPPAVLSTPPLILVLYLVRTRVLAAGSNSE